MDKKNIPIYSEKILKELTDKINDRFRDNNGLLLTTVETNFNNVPYIYEVIKAVERAFKPQGFEVIMKHYYIKDGIYNYSWSVYNKKREDDNSNLPF